MEEEKCAQKILQMTRDILAINDFVVLIEASASEATVVERCGFDRQIVCFSFYGSGNVDLTVNYEGGPRTYTNTKGLAISFAADKGVEFIHTISASQPLNCICVYATIPNLLNRPEYEVDTFVTHVPELLEPKESYVEGPAFYMSPDMLSAVDKIFNTRYQGATRLMFIRSQVMELLSHFFAIAAGQCHIKPSGAADKLFQVKEILERSMDAPPSLQELSRMIGLNSSRLKKDFREMFGMPVFKYLQQERLGKAHSLLTTTDKSIQEVAWFVGYDSLSSFSSAFLKKFGIRPSEVRKKPS